MADYLRHLAERTMAPGFDVRPIVPPRFARGSVSLPEEQEVFVEADAPVPSSSRHGAAARARTVQVDSSRPDQPELEPWPPSSPGQAESTASRRASSARPDVFDPRSAQSSLSVRSASVNSASGGSAFRSVASAAPSAPGSAASAPSLTGSASGSAVSAPRARGSAFDSAVSASGSTGSAFGRARSASLARSASASVRPASGSDETHSASPAAEPADALTADLVQDLPHIPPAARPGRRRLPMTGAPDADRAPHTVHVTIGRLEVRTAAARPVRTSRSAGPSMSLDDFQRSRSRGGAR